MPRGRTGKEGSTDGGATIARAALTFERAWFSLGSPERAVLELAWASCAAGTTGVGTAVLDERGAVLAFARNATRGPGPANMPLAGSYVAHAEINAIAQIPTSRRLEQCTVLTSLLPCVMCAGAMVMSHVGRVRYLAPDPVFTDFGKLGEVSDFIRNQWPIYEAGPPDEWAVVALLLGAHAKAIAKPDGVVMATHERLEPEVAGLVRKVIRLGVVTEAAALGMPLEKVLDQIWGDVVVVTAERRGRLMLRRSQES